MNEVIERVARAICASHNHQIIWPRQTDPQYLQIAGPYLRMALAAIQAMREPTEQMLLATHEEMGNAATIWQSMIDAALKEP